MFDYHIGSTTPLRHHGPGRFPRSPAVGLDGCSPRDLRRGADLSRFQARLGRAAGRAQGIHVAGPGGGGKSWDQW